MSDELAQVSNILELSDVMRISVYRLVLALSIERDARKHKLFQNNSIKCLIIFDNPILCRCYEIL